MKNDRELIFELLDEHVLLSSGVTDSFDCVDCGVNTAPGCTTRKEAEAELYRPGRKGKVVGQMRVGPDTELFMVREVIWKKTGLGDWGGCLCVGCIEKRIGRRLKPKDFDWSHVFNSMPGSARLLKRRKHTQ